jgi:hypothetical protein
MRCSNYLFTFIIIALLFNKGITIAQSTVLKLPTTDNTTSFDIADSSNRNIAQFFADGGFYIGGSSDSQIPIEWKPRVMLWYPGKAAFRAGGLYYGYEWNDFNIGDFSAAMGYATIASGLASISLGYFSSATNDYSTAVGYYARASGLYSTALGKFVSTNDHSGAFIMGDNSSGTTFLNSSANNQMTMRFAGGYRLFTNSGATIGAQLNPNDNSWSTISDSSKKENFIYADGEQFLKNLSKLKLGSWNYKTQDEKKRRYGPMAQEIFQYFGKDELGTIGNDTTLATADIDGIIMICLQALEKRTAQLKKAKEELTKLEEKFLEAERREQLNSEKIEKLSQVISVLLQKESNNNEYSFGY